MRIDCYFTHQSCPANALPGSTTIVIDVLRATSSMITALAAGTRAIIPVAQVADALALHQSLPDTLLAGERNGNRLEGFMLGNSPYEFTAERVAGRVIIACTTNGTAAIHKARNADRLWLAALLNTRAVAEKLRQEQPEVCLILCSGTDGQPSLDDTFTAGAILAHLQDMGLFDWEQANDGSQMALQLYRDFAAGDYSQVLARSYHGRRLIGFGYAQDLAYCARQDSVELVPYLDQATGHILGDR